MKTKVDILFDVINDARNYASQFETFAMAPGATQKAKNEYKQISLMLRAYANCIGEMDVEVNDHCMPFLPEIPCPF